MSIFDGGVVFIKLCSPPLGLLRPSAINISEGDEFVETVSIMCNRGLKKRDFKFFFKKICFWLLRNFFLALPPPPPGGGADAFGP